MADFPPASWIAILVTLSGALIVVFMNRKGQ